MTIPSHKHDDPSVSSDSVSEEPPSTALPPTVPPHAPTPPDPAGPVLLVPSARPLPEYALVRRLGEGGFGEVWEASGPGGVHVALKFVRLDGPAGQIEMRSLQLMKNVRHAHLIAQFGAWQIGTYLVVAMELAERTLRDRLNEARTQGHPGIPTEEFFEYLREVAKGLDFLNEPRHPTGDGDELAGIQHKDVKPQNLLLLGGTAKVADFGLAKILAGNSTSAHGMTPLYAAPEFFRNQATRWSDQYSLAVCYCHLRGGRAPFQGSAAELMVAHLQSPPDLSMIPDAERPAVARALSKTPEDRWPTCRAFVDALTSSEPPVPARRRSRAALWLVAVAVALSAVGIAWYFTPPSEQAIAERIEELCGTRQEEDADDGTTFAVVDLSATAVRDEDVGMLKHLPRMRKLSLADTKITDVGLARLCGCAQLEEVDVSRCKGVSDEGLKHLASLESLKSVHLNDVRVSDDGLAHVKRWSKLRELSLAGCAKIAVEGLAHLGELRGLESLDLDNTQLDDGGLTHLKSLTQLRRLSLKGCPNVTDVGLDHLAGLKELRRLDLGPAITKEGLRHLHGLSKLVELNLRGTKIVQEDCLNLKVAIPSLSVSFDGL